MRLLPVSLLVTLFASTVIAEAPEQRLGAADIPGEITPPSSDEGVDDVPQPTIFNGVEVPPLPEIEGEKFGTVVKDGYWFVKHHSYIALDLLHLQCADLDIDHFVHIAFTLRQHGKPSTNSTTHRNPFQREPRQILHPLP
jgi:hypothetical protein